MQKVWEYNKVRYVHSKLESFINVRCDETFEVSEYLCITIFLGLLDIRFRRLEVDDVIDATVRLF